MALREKVVIAPGWQESLRQHGLDRVDTLHAASTGGDLLLGRRATELRRVRVGDGAATRTLYIKKYWYPTARLRWSGFWRGTFLGASKVRTEFENLGRLRAWGLDAPAAVAYGEERDGRWLHRSFLISEGVPEAFPLDLFIRDYLPSLERRDRRRVRRETIEHLADTTRKMHERRFVHHDYFWRNILLSGTSLDHFFLIDSHKGHCWKPWMETRSRAKDLATLDAPAPWFFRRSERLRFFLRYRNHPRLTPDDKHLLRLVLRVAEPLRAPQWERVRRARRLPGRRRSAASTQQMSPSLWKRFRYRLEGGLLELLAATVPLLPRKTLVRLANAAGRLAFHVLGRERRTALTNLDIAFGQSKSAEEKRAIACTAFQTVARSLLGLFWSRRVTRATFERWIEVDRDSLRPVENARARGRGIIFVTPHYGEWELLGLATALYGFPITIVMEQIRNPRIARLFQRLRSREGNRIILQRFALTKLYKALKRGEYIALLIDLNAVPSRGGIWLDFFGKPVFSYSVAAGLALRTGAAIVGGVAYPSSDGRVRIVYGPEIPYSVTGDEETDMRVISQDCLRYCEEVIRQRPEFWLWLYRRWKFRPMVELRDFPDYSRYLEEVPRPRAQTVSASQSPSVPQQSGP
ncbi:MAG TPA: lipopolysaccharide kinase InaA family protein [Verrucomicrobiae bacterium]|nr:lipopolysaccharide kinase InaA family protein [Verrucomicrobiae bacterium]